MEMDRYTKYTLWLIAVSFAIRFFGAAVTELGNDEVYYYLYALYPDWSHFDHPGMVGWIIQLFTLNLLFDSELALRMPSLVLGSAGIWIAYRTGTLLSGKRCGFFTAMLYAASIYASVICGLFIMPDTPQSFFWLLSMYFFLKAFKYSSGKAMIAAGFFTGLAFLSKYTSVFLWSGAGLYVLLCDRAWLKRKELYMAAAVTLFCSLPVAVWNIQNDFISLAFHSGRVTGTSLRPDYFGRELAGEFFYNNPIVFVITFLAVLSFFRKKVYAGKRETAFLVLTALPFILLFWIFALQRATLPHWTGPAYITLIPLAAMFIDGRTSPEKAVNPYAAASAILAAMLVPLAVLQINTGIMDFGGGDRKPLGKDDFTLDMYGWEQFAGQFENPGGDPIVSCRWFPAAHLDYYVARSSGVPLYCFGPLDEIHKYKWINQARGIPEEGSDAWYITTGRTFRDPRDLFSPGNGYSEYSYAQITPADTVEIYRRGKHVSDFYVYRMERLEKGGLQPMQASAVKPRRPCLPL